MNREMIVALLVSRIKSDMERNADNPMTIGQVPEVYRQEVEEKLHG